MYHDKAFEMVVPTDLDNVIGSALLVDFEGYKAWALEDPNSNKDVMWKHLYQVADLAANSAAPNRRMLINAFNDCFYNVQDNTDSFFDFGKEHLNAHLSKLEKRVIYTEKYEQKFKLYFVDEVLAVIGTGFDVRFFIPTRFVSCTLAKKYDDSELQKLRAASDSSIVGIVPAKSRLSIDKTTESIKEVNSQLLSNEKETKDVHDAKAGELADLQAQIDAMTKTLKEKQANLMAALNQKKAELEVKKFQMETQLYMLESEIYGIRCYLGETINFTKLRKGAPASIDTPMVIYQKVRYLDEELGKLAAIYDVDGEFDYIEEFFANSEYTDEFFVPSQRSVSLVRISKTGKVTANSDMPGFVNTLKEYRLQHGSCIGIMIRDGENLWMGWTEEYKINIKEDLFYTPKTAVESVVDEGNDFHHVVTDSEKSEIVLGKEKLRQIQPMVSRAFVINILQGVFAGQEPLVKFQEPVNLAEQMKNPAHPISKYVVFSAADGWLEDTRFGTMSDIINKCNSKMMIGDPILVTQWISGVKGNGYEADRGRGWAHRTEDCKVEDGAIYPLNLVEVLSHSKYYYFKSAHDERNKYISPSGATYCYRTDFGDCTDKDIEERIESQKKDNSEVVDIEEQDHYGYYISVKKKWSEAGATSNMRIYSDEYINLCYMNTEWIQYLLTTRKTDSFREFASAVKYLRAAMQYVKPREEHERELILKYYPALDKIPDWPVLLTEWKLDNARNITDFQAKRFAKYLILNK